MKKELKSFLLWVFIMLATGFCMFVILHSDKVLLTTDERLVASIPFALLGGISVMLTGKAIDEWIRKKMEV